MRAELLGMLEQLLTHPAQDLTLDFIGDVIGARSINQSEIEWLLVEIERAGKHVVVSNPKIRQNLRPVLEQARRLRNEQGGTPNVNAIAAATGLSSAEVRAALLFASVMGR